MEAPPQSLHLLLSRPCGHDIADEDDEGSADEEKEEPDRRQRRAVTTPHVLELADADRPGDVYCPVECAGPRE
jgi:hypothetical protein